MSTILKTGPKFSPSTLNPILWNPSNVLRANARRSILHIGGGSVKRWPGNNPLWPEPATGTTDIRIATGEIAPSGEHADWLAQHDPVLRLARALATNGPEAVDRLASLDAAVRRSIDDAVTFALASPFPAPESAFARVFA